MWSGGLGRLAIHLGTSATHEPRGNASIASLGLMLCRVKILGTRGDSSPTAASEKEIIAEYQIVGKSANGAEVVGVMVQRHLRYLGGRRCGGVSTGGIGTMVEGHEDTGTGCVEGVCLERRNAATKARQERRNKSVTPHAGQKYDDCGGGGGAAVRQETTTLSMCRSSSHTWMHVFV